MVRDSKPSPILITKIEPPRPAAALLERPRLLALLPQVRSKPLTVIKAAAGFGKTSIALAWAEELRGTDSRVAWLGLDRDDDVPGRLLYYAGHALRRACDGLGSSVIEMVAEISLLPVETAISALINELAELDDEVFLFLDDYHNITEPTIHEGVSFLLRHAPSNFHLVLISRTDPPLPLARMRAQNQVLEVDASALRFDPVETRRFLEQEKLASLNPGEVAMLHSTTEGWPAVLRLIASASLHGQGGLEPYLRSMAGVPRPIEAYLGDMLATLPEEIVAFMLRTAILDRFNAALCDAVTLAESSQNSLDSIEQRQLLMTPLGQGEDWYRYHPLLADFLRRRLVTQFGDEVPELHRRAAQWLAAEELWTDAVGHALEAGDTAQAVGWIENCAMAMVKRGELLTLLAWQRQFPDQVMRGQSKVMLAIAWGLALAMRFDESLALLANIEKELPAHPVPAREDVAGECQTIRSVDLALQDDTAAALALAEPCVQRRDGDPWNANVASNVMRLGLWKAGELEAFYSVPWQPYSDEDDHRNVLSHVYRLCLQGLVEFQQLRLGIAERHFLEALRRGEQLVGSQSTCAALPASLLARIRFEEDRLDEAEAFIGDRLPTINATGWVESVLAAYVVLARIAASRNNIERAYALLEQGCNLGYARHWGRLIAALEVEHLKLYLGEGRISEASASLIRLDRMVSDYPTGARCAWSEIDGYRLLARAHLALAKRNAADAVTTLRGLREETSSAQRRYFGVRVDTLLAIALLDAGEPVKAMEVFQDVVRHAAPSRIYRTILDSGPEIGSMLPQLRQSFERKRESGPLLSYVDHLLDGWRILYQGGTGQDRSGGVADSLSARERSILELVAEGSSNKEIAKSLGIAPETVKSHLKSIFDKLAVEKRAQAVARAQSLGLLRTQPSLQRPS